MPFCTLLWRPFFDMITFHCCCIHHISTVWVISCQCGLHWTGFVTVCIAGSSDGTKAREVGSPFYETEEDMAPDGALPAWVSPILFTSVQLMLATLAGRPENKYCAVQRMRWGPVNPSRWNVSMLIKGNVAIISFVQLSQVARKTRTRRLESEELPEQKIPEFVELPSTHVGKLLQIIWALNHVQWSILYYLTLLSCILKLDDVSM